MVLLSYEQTENRLCIYKRVMGELIVLILCNFVITCTMKVFVVILFASSASSDNFLSAHI